MPSLITKIDNGFVEVASSFGKLGILSVECDGKVVKPSSIFSSIRKKLV